VFITKNAGTPKVTGCANQAKEHDQVKHQRGQGKPIEARGRSFKALIHSNCAEPGIGSEFPEDNFKERNGPASQQGGEKALAKMGNFEGTLRPKKNSFQSPQKKVRKREGGEGVRLDEKRRRTYPF